METDCKGREAKRVCSKRLKIRQMRSILICESCKATLTESKKPPGNIHQRSTSRVCNKSQSNFSLVFRLPRHFLYIFNVLDLFALYYFCLNFVSISLFLHTAVASVLTETC